MSTAAVTPLTIARTGKHRAVALDEISIDPKVQRDEGVNQPRVNKMASAFDRDALGVLILSQRRDGTLVCLDGAHRTAAARQAGHAARMDAIVFTGLSMAEEASLFLLYNDKKDPSAISRFKARVIAGDPVAVDVNRIIAEHGWKVSTAKNDTGVLAAIDKAEAVYRNAGKTMPEGAYPEVLDSVLTILTAAWEHDPKSTHGALLIGVSQLIGRFGKAIDYKKVIDEMQGTRPGVLMGKARNLADIQGGTVSAAVAKILVGLHNNRRRTNLLPEWVWTR